MALVEKIRDGLQVLGSDGGMIGVVDAIEERRVRLHSTAEPSGHFYIPSHWIDRVDDHVHLNLTAATARERWEPVGDVPDARRTSAPGTTGDRAGGGRTVFAWVIGAILLVAILIFAARSCGYAVDESTNTEQALPSADSDAPGTGAANGQ